MPQIFTTTVAGLVPAPGSVQGKVLGDDAKWHAPLAGPAGPAGAAGPQGIQGIQGPPGPVPEAPKDGQVYGRKDGTWAVIGAAAPPPPPSTVDARTFSVTTHAGTAADPWPGGAIKAAIESLPAAGGTVSVADGIWKVDAPLLVNASKFALVGQSLNARLVFTGAGQLWFPAFPTCTISTLTIDPSGLDFTAMAAVRVSGAVNSFFSNNAVLGHPNGATPAVFFEGGSNNQIVTNTATGGPMGGTVLQLQALGGTLNSGFTISGNTFDSTALLVIGLSDTHITNNHFNNRTLSNYISIEVSGPFSGSCSNVTVDGNTVDATVGGANGAVITGLPQDPGGTSNIDGFAITNNILKGTGSLIAVQSLDPNNYNPGGGLAGNNKKNVTITGNQINSLWGGSIIDIRGGDGTVDIVSVQSNTLANFAGTANLIKQDAHTTNATVQNNTGV